VCVFLCLVLILVPTRELALQTSSVVRELGKHMSIECMVTTGGTSLKDDIMRLYNTVHILVGTPGRILDLASKGVANLTQCKTVIMDEVRGCVGHLVGKFSKWHARRAPLHHRNIHS